MGLRAGAAVVLVFAVCCLLVAPTPARQSVDLPRQLPDAVDCEGGRREIDSRPVVEVADAEAADQGTAVAVQQEGHVREGQRSSLLCLVFRCGGRAEPTGTGKVAVARGSSQERQALDGWAQPTVAGTAAPEEVHGEEQGAYDSDSDWSDWDSDCDSDCDSDDEDEGGIVGWFWRLIVGWFWRLADGF